MWAAPVSKRQLKFNVTAEEVLMFLYVEYNMIITRELQGITYYGANLS